MSSTPTAHTIVDCSRSSAVCLLDGFPISAQHLSYLAHYSYKYFQYVKSLLLFLRKGEPLNLHESSTRTMYIPLGCFISFEPRAIPMSNCDIDYAFPWVGHVQLV